MIRGQEGNFLTLIKGMYKKPTANIILDGERLTALSLRPGAGQWCLFSAFLFNISPEVLATVIRKETEIKEIQIWKEETNCPYLQMKWLCTYKIPKKLQKKKKNPRTNKWVQQGFRIQDQHVKINFLYISNEQEERKPLCYL